MTCAICWDRPDACKRPDHIAVSARRAELRGRPWSLLSIRTDTDRVRALSSGIELIYGERHYLDDRPIHCGDFLELQKIDTREDDFGSFTVYLQEGAVVRYEVEHGHGDIDGISVTYRIPTMYVGAAGRSFKAKIDHGCYFRWPERSE